MFFHVYIFVSVCTSSLLAVKHNCSCSIAMCLKDRERKKERKSERLIVSKLTRERTWETRKWAQRSRLGWPQVRGTRCSRRGLPVSARCCAPCWPTWYPWRTPSRIRRCLLHPWSGVITWRSEPDHTCTTQNGTHLLQIIINDTRNIYAITIFEYVMITFILYSLRTK